MVSQGKINRAGLLDWLIQRSSAVIVGAYTIFIIIYLLVHQPNLTYLTWHALYARVWVRIFTVITVISVLWHAWIGLWTVFTDYVKPKMVRILLEIIVALLLLSYLFWLLDILWR